MDGIARGADYRQVIEGAVGQASAMVVVIGPQWLACTDAHGNRRLDDPADWVRNEVAAGLRREIVVLPVLVDGAAMPAAEQLPPDVAPLAFMQAGEISNTRWQYDLGEVTRSLERVVTPAAGITPRRTRKRLGTALVGVALVATAGLGSMYFLVPEPDPSPGGDVAAPPAASAAAPAPAGPVAPPSATGNVPVPVIYGLTYDEARKRLIGEGWIPAKHNWQYGDSVQVQSGNGPCSGSENTGRWMRAREPARLRACSASPTPPAACWWWSPRARRPTTGRRMRSWPGIPSRHRGATKAGDRLARKELPAADPASSRSPACLAGAGDEVLAGRSSTARLPRPRPPGPSACP